MPRPICALLSQSAGLTHDSTSHTSTGHFFRILFQITLIFLTRRGPKSLQHSIHSDDSSRLPNSLTTQVFCSVQSCAKKRRAHRRWKEHLLQSTTSCITIRYRITVNHQKYLRFSITSPQPSTHVGPSATVRSLCNSFSKHIAY